MENRKLSKEELQKIQELQQRKQNLQMELGRLEVLKLEIEERRRQLIEYGTETSNQEQTLVTDLEESYGKGTIDLEKGEFIPTEMDMVSEPKN